MSKRLNRPTAFGDALEAGFTAAAEAAVARAQLQGVKLAGKVRAADKGAASEQAAVAKAILDFGDADLQASIAKPRKRSPVVSKAD